MRKALCSILAEAGNELLKARSFSVTEKEGHANYVTDVDKRLQDMLMERLRALCPEAQFIGEERTNQKLTAAPTWVVDPIDGTTNFIHDYHCSVISAALLVDRVPQVGVVCQPYLHEVYSAERGKGAFTNDEPMHVSRHDFDHALVGFGTSPYQAELGQPTMDIALAFLRRCADIRRCGSAAADLAYVACGRQDVFFELNLKPWDIAAGSLLVTEAGGTFDMPLLDRPDFDTPTTMFAANALCAAPAKEMLVTLLRSHSIDQALMEKLAK